MKKRHIFLFFFITAAAFSHSYAENFYNQSPEQQSLDQEIESREKNLAQMRKEALNLEIKAQSYMFDNWHEFAEDIRLNEEREKEILSTKKKLKELYNQKDALLKQPSPK